MIVVRYAVFDFILYSRKEPAKNPTMQFAKEEIPIGLALNES